MPVIILIAVIDAGDLARAAAPTPQFLATRDRTAGDIAVAANKTPPRQPSSPPTPPSKTAPPADAAPSASQVPPAPRPATAEPTPPLPPPPPETVEIDVSTRTVAVTSLFGGTEIVVFGTVANSRQPDAQSGYYDLVLVLEGQGATSIVRQKSNMAGLWINMSSVGFDNLPLYSAIVSTRPLDQIAEPQVMAAHGIGFARARMFPNARSSRVTVAQLEEYKTAVLRLKESDGLYVRQDRGVAFIGHALFRASVNLPANIPVGPLEARAYLFHEGRLLATQKASVKLERQGLDRLVYDFAFEHPFWYGILTVAVAAIAGIAASAAFRRQTGFR